MAMVSETLYWNERTDVIATFAEWQAEFEDAKARDTLKEEGWAEEFHFVVANQLTAITCDPVTCDDFLMDHIAKTSHKIAWTEIFPTGVRISDFIRHSKTYGVRRCDRANWMEHGVLLVGKKNFVRLLDPENYDKTTVYTEFDLADIVLEVAEKTPKKALKKLHDMVSAGEAVKLWILEDGSRIAYSHDAGWRKISDRKKS